MQPVVLPHTYIHTQRRAFVLTSDEEDNCCSVASFTITDLTAALFVPYGEWRRFSLLIFSAFGNSVSERERGKGRAADSCHGSKTKQYLFFSPLSLYTHTQVHTHSRSLSASVSLSIFQFKPFEKGKRRETERYLLSLCFVSGL